MKKKLLISACLIGDRCRYDGRSKPHPKIESIREKFDLFPVCPEVLGGLKTPRLPCEMRENRVIRKDGQDLTTSYLTGAETVLNLAKKENISLALLKEKSPSCGKNFIYDGTFSKKLISGMGVCAKLLSENKIEIFSEEETKLLEKKTQ